jgi:hypothetical protein
MSGRHRHTGPVGRFLARAAGALIAAAALIAAFAISGLRPPAPMRPFAGASTIVDVTIVAARQAGVITAGPSAHDTQAAWLVLTIRVTALHEPASVGYAAVKSTDGTVYLASRRIAQPLIDGTRLLQPGIALQGDIAFEVPRHVLPGLTAAFAPAAVAPLGIITELPVPGTGAFRALKPPPTELAAPALPPPPAPAVKS